MIKIKRLDLCHLFCHFRITLFLRWKDEFFLFFFLFQKRIREANIPYPCRSDLAISALETSKMERLSLFSMSENCWEIVKIVVPFMSVMLRHGQIPRLFKKMILSPCSFCGFWPLLWFSFHFASLPITTRNPTDWKIVSTGCWLLQCLLTSQDAYKINMFMLTGGLDCKKI